VTRFAFRATIPAWFVALACAGNTTPGDEERPSRTAAHATADTVQLELRSLPFDAPLRIAVPLREAYRTAGAWEATWRDATAGIVPAPEPPDVDFDVEIALLVAAGERPTGGHTVTIEAARLIGDTLHVDTVERSPGRGCMVTQAITYPATAAAVERVDAEVVFHVREERRDC